MRNFRKNPDNRRNLRIVEDREGEPKKLFWGLILLLVVAGLVLYILISSYNCPKDQELAIYVPPRVKKTSNPTPSPSSSFLNVAARKDMQKPPHHQHHPPPPGVINPHPDSEAVPPPPEMHSNYGGSDPPAGNPGPPIVHRRFIPDEPTSDKTVDFVPDRVILYKKVPVTIYSNMESYVFIDNKIGRRCYGKTKLIKEKKPGRKYCLKTMLKPGDYHVELTKKGYNKATIRVSILAGMKRYEVYMELFAK